MPSEPFIELDEWLEPYRQLWRASLDRLEEHLTESQPSPGGSPDD